MIFRRARSNSAGSAGFTLVEMLMAISIFTVVTAGLVSFSSFTTRTIARNLATNRTHETVRISNLQFLRYFHESASAFRLLDFNGTTYTDTTPAGTSDQDATTGRYASTRSNGVRFRRLAGGPFRFTANTTTGSTNLSFDFGVNGQVPYVPNVGDKLVIPLVSREFDISAVPTVPTAGSPTGTVTIADAGGLGFTINATAAGNTTTAYFYRSTAFTVWNDTLRYHNDFTGARKPNFTVVRTNVTSPKPFSLLYTSPTGTTDGLSVRISLEAHDGDYSARRFANGTATLQAVIPTRFLPTPITSTNSN